jgi:hypothetical protein
MERPLFFGFLMAALVAAGCCTSVVAQTPPTSPDVPGTTRSTGAGETLSERLHESEGVIRPPAGIDPEIRVPAPVPDPGTTPVIPPPGSPGGNPAIQPK